MMIEPPAHARIGAEPKVDAGVVIRVERHAFERVAIAMDHADRTDVDVSFDRIAVVRREQRRRGRAVETRVVKKDLEETRQGAERSYPATGIRTAQRYVG